MTVLEKGNFFTLGGPTDISLIVSRAKDAFDQPITAGRQFIDLMQTTGTVAVALGRLVAVEILKMKRDLIAKVSRKVVRRMRHRGAHG